MSKSCSNIQYCYCRGPRGATGPVGVILGSYNTIEELREAHPTGNQGDAYLVGGELYIWDESLRDWRSVGNLQGPAGSRGLQGAIGPTGPTGPRGDNGVDGIVGEINGVVENIEDLPTTGVEQGTIYYVEEDGSLHIWDDTLNDWILLNVAQGPRGATGPTGPQGADGTIGSISGIVATTANLPSTGITQGTIYYVEEDMSLYIWDTASGWSKLDIAQGPRGVTGPAGPTGAEGPTGPQGNNGEDGVIGTIDGIVDTVDNLPTTGITQGTIYYVEENESLYIWDDTTNDWTLLNVAQGPRGVTGPTGATGADGIIGPISGVVDTVTNLPTIGITQGTIYYVEEDESLYVWDSVNGWTKLGIAQGPRGTTGPQGPAASSYMIIPFASTEAPQTHSNNGNPSMVTLLGFGYGDRRGENSLDAAEYMMPIDPTNYSFSLNGNPNKQLVFSLPFDVSIRSIYITVGNWGEFDPPYAVFPYVQLYSAEEGTNNFTAIEGAFAIPEQGIGPGSDVPANTMRYARKTGLDIKLKAGTRIGIGALMQMPGDTGGNRAYWIYFTGGIGMTYEEEI